LSGSPIPLSSPRSGFEEFSRIVLGAIHAFSFTNLQPELGWDAKRSDRWLETARQGGRGGDDRPETRRREKRE